MSERLTWVSFHTAQHRATHRWRRREKVVALSQHVGMKIGLQASKCLDLGVGDNDMAFALLLTKVAYITLSAYSLAILASVAVWVDLCLHYNTKYSLILLNLLMHGCICKINNTDLTATASWNMWCMAFCWNYLESYYILVFAVYGMLFFAQPIMLLFYVLWLALNETGRYYIGPVYSAWKCHNT